MARFAWLARLQIAGCSPPIHWAWPSARDMRGLPFEPAERSRSAARSEAIFTPMTAHHGRTPGIRMFTAVIVAVVLAGCTQSASSTIAPTRTSSAPDATSATPRAVSTPARKRAQHPAGAGRRSPSGLAYSDASAQSVQAQPAPGSCHAIGSGLYSRPDPRCTPGALDPAVTQATIGETICVPGWTATVRPPESVTESAAYADIGPMSYYEYDHFVPLELGGAVNDPRNLWPEPGASPNPKDAVEDDLNQDVCDGQMTLAHAQRTVTTNWRAHAARVPAPATTLASGSTSPPPRSAGAAQCTVSASYNSVYDDYDAYVNSNPRRSLVARVSMTRGGLRG